MIGSNWVYGVVGSDGGHIDTSDTERGAKRKATSDGYNVVTRRHDVSWAVEIVAHKRGARWFAGEAPEPLEHTGRLLTCSTNGTEYPLYDAPLWGHEQGRQQTTSGYGAKLTTRYKVLFAGRMRRLYATCYGNAASLWCEVDGVKHFFN